MNPGSDAETHPCRALRVRYLWKEMLEAHDKRLQLAKTATARREVLDAGTERRLRIKREQRLEEKEMYGKAVTDSMPGADGCKVRLWARA